MLPSATERDDVRKNSDTCGKSKRVSDDDVPSECDEIN